MVKQVTILGKRWRFRRKRLPKNDGLARADWASKSSHDLKNREIVIASHVTGERELDVVIHEVLHAADWHRSEEWVGEVASDLARILWRLGYRKESP